MDLVKVPLIQSLLYLPKCHGIFLPLDTNTFYNHTDGCNALCQCGAASPEVVLHFFPSKSKMGTHTVAHNRRLLNGARRAKEVTQGETRRGYYGSTAGRHHSAAQTLIEGLYSMPGNPHALVQSRRPHTHIFTKRITQEDRS